MLLRKYSSERTGDGENSMVMMVAETKKNESVSGCAHSANLTAWTVHQDYRRLDKYAKNLIIEKAW